MLGLGIGRNKRLRTGIFGWSPSMFKSLVAWYESRYGVNAKTAASFTAANSEYLSTASTDFNFGNESFSMGCLFKLDSFGGGFPILFSKFDISSNQRSYQLYLSSNELRFRVSNDGTATTDIDEGTTLSTGTWYYGLGVYDSDNDIQKVLLDDGSFVVVSNSTGAYSFSTADFLIGANNVNQNPFDGLIDVPFIFGKALTFAENHVLNNNGNGVAPANYSDLNGTMVAVAQKLNGTDQAFNIDSVVSPLSATTTGGIEIYVKTTDATPATALRLINFGDTNGTDKIDISLNTDGTISVAARAASLDWGLQSSVSLSNDTFVKINLIQNGVSPKIYFNDVEDLGAIFTTDNDRTTWFSSYSGIDNGRIGCRNFNSQGNDRFWSGAIQNVKIWSDSTQTNLVAYWLMNDVEGANQVDSTGNGYDATPINTPVSTLGTIENTTIENIEVGLVDAFPFNELSGNRTGINGTVLTDNNTVGSALGKVVEPIENGEAVFQWLDKSGNNYHSSQDTFASQPVYSSTVPDLVFNGTTDFLPIDNVLTALSSTTKGAICGWINMADATPSGTVYILAFGDTNADTYLRVVATATGLLVASLRVAGSNRWQLTTTNPFISNNTPVHWGIIHNGTQASLYVMGDYAEQSFTIDTAKSEWIAAAPNLDNGRIGCINYNSGGDSGFITADMQQIEFFNDELTAAEMKRLSNYNKPT